MFSTAFGKSHGKNGIDCGSWMNVLPMAEKYLVLDMRGHWKTDPHFLCIKLKIGALEIFLSYCVLWEMFEEDLVSYLLDSQYFSNVSGT